MAAAASGGGASSGSGAGSMPAVVERSQSAKFLTEALSKELRPYVDLTDDLRDILGPKSEIALPILAVVGNQSAGKSSCLERLSGIQLPRGDGMVTRCPLEMALRCQPSLTQRRVKAGLDRAALKDLESTDAAAVIEELTQQLLAKADKESQKFGVTKERIYLSVEGPDLPDITLIDLPGIYQIDVTTKQVLPGLVDYLKSLYREFICTKECVVVCVLPATDDLGNQLARGWCQEVDPAGERTVGLLTKVDRAAARETYDRIVGKGKNAADLQLGIVAVRNRGADEDLSVDIDDVERRFFKSFHTTLGLPPLPADACGMDSLVSKLVAVNGARMKARFPMLLHEIRSSRKAKEAELAAMPAACEDERQALELTLDRVDRLFARLQQVYVTHYAVDGLLTKSTPASSTPTVRSPVPVGGGAAGGADAAGGAGLSTVTSPSATVVGDEHVARDFRFMPRAQELFDKFRANINDKQTRVFNKQFNDCITKAIGEVRGRKLDDMCAGEVFDAIMKAEVAKMEDPAMQLLDEIHALFSKCVTAFVAESFGEVPRMQAFVMSLLEDMLEQRKAFVKANIDLLLQLEGGDAFTLDDSYSTTVGYIAEAGNIEGLLPIMETTTATEAGDDRTFESLQRAAEARAKANSTTPAARLPVSVTNLQRAKAELMVRVYAYRRVVQKRFIDYVVGYTRLGYARYLVKDAKHQLRKDILASHEAHNKAADTSSAGSYSAIHTVPPFSLFAALQEPPAIQARRKKLVDDIARLLKAEVRLRSTPV